MGQKKGDPEMLLEISYYMAFISTGMLIIVFILGFLRIEGLQFINNMIWLVMVTSAIGTFLAFITRGSFEEPTDQQQAKMKVALRVNVAALGFMLLLAVCLIAIAMMPSIGPGTAQ